MFLSSETLVILFNHIKYIKKDKNGPNDKVCPLNYICENILPNILRCRTSLLQMRKMNNILYLSVIYKISTLFHIITYDRRISFEEPPPKSKWYRKEDLSHLAYGSDFLNWYGNCSFKIEIFQYCTITHFRDRPGSYFGPCLYKTNHQITGIDIKKLNIKK